MLYIEKIQAHVCLSALTFHFINLILPFLKYFFKNPKYFFNMVTIIQGLYGG